eukprot:TRINITY_DN4916_c0_g1_i2.p1 TRINITY_DN4916_c0_g1~~TRINITY_DN4916_c0_g1_i2.p1  ORF type:complete len:108 (-),score=13.70 TRINITY_DN4916_c0_g1_i2:56-379(-)
MYWIGLGAFHSGLVLTVDGVTHSEYGFGFHPFNSPGVFVTEPGHAPGFVFRENINFGETKLSITRVRKILRDLSQDYPGSSYHLLDKLRIDHGFVFFFVTFNIFHQT